VPHGIFISSFFSISCSVEREHTSNSLDTRNLGLVGFPEHGSDGEFVLNLSFPTAELLSLEPIEFGDFGLLDLKLLLVLLEWLSHDPLSP
jgi:hypothetical protein